jgi:pantetheine-phosphate adenylyltransferase
MSHCLVAGSYDPFTNGHTNMVKQALRLFEKVDIVVANNPAKKYYINQIGDRIACIRMTLMDELSPVDLMRTKVVALGNDLLVNYAQDVGATHMVRGLRNGMDFQYEYSMQDINSQIAPEIDTVYVSCPPSLVSVSSSMVRGLIGLPGWEKLVSKYVNPAVVDQLIKDYIKRQPISPMPGKSTPIINRE